MVLGSFDRRGEQAAGEFHIITCEGLGQFCGELDVIVVFGTWFLAVLVRAPGELA